MPRMISWSDRTYYSIQSDEHLARVTGWDDKHQEFWLEIPTGKGYATRRNDAVQRIMDAIESGRLPGEVR